ncbi:RecB-like exonuclease/helicase [Microbacterium phage Gilda]|uniref:RecB-like exonuclease/helicase n=6 Tax=Krampusvirus krampus TaxID=2734242 RepID=A0A2Z4Q3P9_9CAUD|nr:exonuclease [Microbacterium phage Krampus]AWY04499.1 RecB-like exonuclease/helicase [Microbacterium phage AnnaSerena]QDF18095.1 exonuclease [Microbacterium phage Anakin]QDF18177.1 exonuclease [Microbacterium phage NarutoRun]QOC58702.1 RecB-like exonuclease/helicase [Microbacterium phage Gilda]UDG78663.1 exonuclease [Microbacterium phage Neptune]UDL15522.1 RecB-like exonuclease/helicase [Microbacterium phage Cybele]URP21710.1 RecB-like exonuclease/helicase [Microbacterium phage Kate]USH45
MAATKLEMRTSERGALLGCAQKWYWAHIEELRPNRASNPLWFGSAVHVALAEWYLKGLKRGPHPAETFNKFIDGERTMLVTNEDEEQEYYDARELGTGMLEHYVDTYGKDDSWDVIATEHAGKIVLPRPQMKIFGRVRPALARWLTYHFTWDGIFRDLNDGQLYLMEHKTAAAIDTNHLPLDNQAGSYWAIASRSLVKQGLIGENEDIVGIRYNFLRKALKDTRPQDEDGLYHNQPQKQHYIEALLNHYGEDSPAEEMEGWEKDLPKMTLAQLKELADAQPDLTVLGEISKSQPPAYFHREDVYRTRAERVTQIARIQDEALFSEAYRSGSLPITKRPSKDCAWCPFRRMCELDEQGDQEAVEAFKEAMFHTESPYEVYRIKSA